MNECYALKMNQVLHINAAKIKPTQYGVRTKYTAIYWDNINSDEGEKASLSSQDTRKEEKIKSSSKLLHDATVGSIKYSQKRPNHARTGALHQIALSQAKNRNNSFATKHYCYQGWCLNTFSLVY